jgi:zinc/manganese transport system ATP-binding protein
VRNHFPQCLLLAREVIAWGDTHDVLTENNLQRAATTAETQDDFAPLCDVGAA